MSSSFTRITLIGTAILAVIAHGATDPLLRGVCLLGVVGLGWATGVGDGSAHMRRKYEDAIGGVT